MALPITNVHAHVFNSRCAPDRFLRILPIKFVRRMPRAVKNTIDSKHGIRLIRGLYNIFNWRKSNKRSEIDKYVSFLDIGTEATQLEVFERALEAGLQYDSSIRIVGLTMNMDFMDSKSSKNQISYATQLEEVKEIKRYYPSHFFPFLGVDPRHKSGKQLVEWAKPYFETGVKDKASGNVYPFFCGIKLYPALGFFPFDVRLDDLYAYAQEKNLPVMTHCTRVGSQYIGENIQSLIPKNPDMIMVNNDIEVEVTRASIHARIAAYYDKGWVKNSKLGNNDLACDLFGHPENYIPVTKKFPNLKICLAHMGGSEEIVNSTKGELSSIREVDPTSWFDHIKQMMVKYPSLYTDVSYTISDFHSIDSDVYKNVVSFLGTQDQRGQSLGNRVLFGTDFFMTEQERREAELYAIGKDNLNAWWEKVARENTQQFLMQPF
jgi:uncharacterized protein